MTDVHLPQLIAVETTRRCNLHCIHCRALAGEESVPGELSTSEITGLLDEIAARDIRPIVILTGGEPLLRDDIFDIARHGSELGFTMTIAPNGTLLDAEAARRLVDAGIRRVGVSLDGASPEVHDAFRNMPGAFVGVMKGIDSARAAGLPFQINTSVTAFNVDELAKVHELAKALGATAHHIFMLVRVGRGRQLDAEVSPARQEKVLQWLAERHREGLIRVRATCAPHYFRILTQRAGAEGTAAITRGCLAGRRFVFISSTGHVQPCGYLDIDCGSIRENGFWKVWDTSPVLHELRDDAKLRGKCGICDYVEYCGGCRARAYATTGDYLAEEPACLYLPPKRS
jgi:heme b synthase